MRKTITTERLKLRPLRCADAARVAAMGGDFDVAKQTGSLPSPYPLVAAEGWILIMRARASLGEDHLYAIEDDSEALVGVIGAHKRGQRPFEIGYWVGRPYWGRGYATEAARVLAAEGRASLGPLIAAHYVDNPASGRVLEKAGFEYTGAVERLFSLARGRKDEARMMRQVAAA